MVKMQQQWNSRMRQCQNGRMVKPSLVIMAGWSNHRRVERQRSGRFEWWSWKRCNLPAMAACQSLYICKAPSDTNLASCCSDLATYTVNDYKVAHSLLARVTHKVTHEVMTHAGLQTRRGPTTTDSQPWVTSGAAFSPPTDLSRIAA